MTATSTSDILTKPSESMTLATKSTEQDLQTKMDKTMYKKRNKKRLTIDNEKGISHKKIIVIQPPDISPKIKESSQKSRNSEFKDEIKQKRPKPSKEKFKNMVNFQRQNNTNSQLPLSSTLESDSPEGRHNKVSLDNSVSQVSLPRQSLCNY